MKDDEANNCYIKKRFDEHAGKSSSDSTSTDDERRSPTEEEKATVICDEKCDESCTENEHESDKEGVGDKEDEKAEVMSCWLMQL